MPALVGGTTALALAVPASAATPAPRVVAPPVAKIAQPSDGSVFARGQAVATRFSCTEGAGGSGITSCSDSEGTDTVRGGAGSLDTTTTGPHTYTVTARSSSGLSSTTSITYSVANPPKAVVRSPASGGVYRLGQVVTASFSCSEGAAGPGLMSCQDSLRTATLDGGTATLDTTAPGMHTYRVTARSSSGLTASASISYRVTPAHVAIRTTSAKVKAKQAKVVVGCSGAEVCRGSLRLVGRSKVVGVTTYRVVGGSRVTVSVPVTRSGMRLLRQAKHHRIATTSTATVSGGAQASRTIVLRLP